MATHKCFNPDCDAEVDKKGKYCPPCKKARTREFSAISNAKAAEKKLKAREVNPLPCKGCGGARENAFDPMCKVCREKIRAMRARSRARVKARLDAEEAEIKAKPLPRVTLSDEERDALDREKREADKAAEKELAARRDRLNPQLLMARQLVGAAVPVYDTRFAPNRAKEYQPPQRAQTLAADRMAMWE